MQPIVKVSRAVKPSTVDGVELYVTDSACGMSQIGLARFVDVDEKNIRDLLSLINNKDLKGFEKYYNQELFLPVIGFKNAKIVNSRLCADICTYYAYKATVTTETAKFSLEKFASIGIDTWMRKETGASNGLTSTNPDITALIQQTIRLHQELIDQKDITIKLQESVIASKSYLSNATYDSPGLERLIEASQIKTKALVSGDKPVKFTLKEWLSYQGLHIEDRMYRQLRLKVSQVFEGLKDRTPELEWRVSDGGNSIRPYVYGQMDFPLLKSIFHQVLDAYTSEANTSQLVDKAIHN